MRSVGRLVTPPAAAAAVIGVLVGIPWLLWHLTRPLLPDQWPSWADTVDALTQPDDGTLLLGFLALVGAFAWLVLAFSIVSELVALIARRPVWRIDLPGFRLGRTVAAALVTAMLGTGPVLAAQAAGIPVPVVAAASIEVARQIEPTEETGPVHVVAPRDTLWRIAEVALGNPLRWREIYELNVGRPQPDGDTLGAASDLNIGWRLILPADAHDVVRVEPGDTLTGLAAEHLGDPSRFDELYATNAGRPQPGDATLDDPDLIRPGWLLALPGPAPVDVHEAPRDPPVGAPLPTSPPDRTGVAPPPIESGPTVAPAPGTVADHDDDPGPAVPVTLVGVSSLIVGGVLAALTLRRRRQLRNRLPRHRIAVPTDGPGRLEWAAGRAEPDMTTAFLDAALRTLALANWHGIEVPSLRSVRLEPARAVIALDARASLPPPFVAIGDRDDWTLDASDPLPVPIDEAGGCCAPFPTLVSIATDAERTLLIDLEQRGLIHVSGEPSRAIALLRHIAAELAISRSAEDVEVMLIGLGTELIDLNPDRLSAVPDLRSGLAEIAHRAEVTRAAVRRLPVGSVVDGRLRDVASDSWLPTVLLVAVEPDEDDRERLTQFAATLAETDRAAVAVVVVGAPPCGTELRISDDGTLHLPDVTDGPWHVEGLTESAGTQLAAILGATSSPAEPVGPAPGGESWTGGMNEDGSLDVEDADGDVNDGTPPPETPLPAPRRAAAEGDPEAARRLAIVEHQDPHLDDDLAAWWNDGPPSVPMIAILGEPTVRAPGPLPSVRPSWFTEVLAYLSLHPAGVTADKALTDLWPEGCRIRTATVRHAIYGARRWAGRGLGGDKDVPFVSDMQNDNTYRLRGHLLDWDLFRRLRKRGQARRAAGHPGAAADYEAALALVRGPVLSGLRPGGYAWLNNHDQRHDLQIPGFVIDAAHELVDIALDDGDTASARRAAERARLVDIDVAFDRPLTDLMRIAHAEDNRSELELYAAVLLDARGFEVPEELAPDTFAVLNELLPAGPRKPRT